MIECLKSCISLKQRHIHTLGEPADLSVGYRSVFIYLFRILQPLRSLKIAWDHQNNAVIISATKPNIYQLYHGFL